MHSGFCKQCRQHFAIDARFDERKHAAQCPLCKSLLSLNGQDSLSTVVLKMRLSKSEIGMSLAGFITYGGHK